MVSETDVAHMNSLTRLEILAELQQEGVKMSRDQKRCKSDLIELFRTQPDAVAQPILARINARKLDKANIHRKRKTEQQHGRRDHKRQCIEVDNTPQPFLTLPSQEDMSRVRKAFLEATSNQALQRSICVSCARELPYSLGQKQILDSLSHPERLVPKVPHPAHKTVNSMLLVVEKITSVDGRKEGWFCKDCLKAINANLLPPLALANRMWIGPIPVEISCLTVPEQILVSLYHPRCYVYKLYPRDLWSKNSSSSSLQNGLKGNVTTYELNMPDITRMLEGKLVPRPTCVLASMIAVSFIGAGRVPRSWLKKTFCVRRAVVLAAIQCLKETTKHPGYKDIEISQDALAKLPVDDIPIEILAAIQYEPDVEKAQKEAESYLQNEQVPDCSGKSYRL
jgi:hypothetical protein